MNYSQALSASRQGDKLSRTITGTDDVSVGRSALATV